MMQRTEPAKGELVGNAEEMLARRPYEPRNPLNPYKDSRSEYQPKDTQNDIGNTLIRNIRDTQDTNEVPVRVEWDHKTQMKIVERKAVAVTYNFNGALAPEDRGAHLVMVGLGPDATNAAVYEEYLHVKAAEARGWAPTNTKAEGLFEEVRVEYQVLINAHKLRMFDDEFDTLARLRSEDYVKPLRQRYERWQRKDRTLDIDERRYIKSHHKEIEAYLYGEYAQDPPKPTDLPKRHTR